MSLSMTPKRRLVLEFLSNYWQQHAMAPTIQEIADGLGVTKVTIFEHLSKMLEAGWLVKSKYRTRSLQIGPRCPPFNPGASQQRAGSFLDGVTSGLELAASCVERAGHGDVAGLIRLVDPNEAQPAHQAHPYGKPLRSFA